MVDLNLQIPDEFLQEEERGGYVISQKMKKVWAVQLDMLHQLDCICQKYGLTYYADSGTLIGAIRHQGYIPWDDDIDVVMKRKDYNKLLEIAPKELKSPLFLQTVYSDKDYIRGHAQLRNSATTGFIDSDKKRKCNKGIFIDVFVMDNLPDDEKKYKRFLKKIRFWWKVLKAYQYDKNNGHSFKGRLFCNTWKIIYRFVDYRKVFRYYEKLCSRYQDIDTKRLSDIAFSKGKEKRIWETKWFDSAHRVPFEFIDIVIPDGFDGRLRKEYGEYMVIQHTATAHGNVTLNADIPYDEYLLLE